MKKGSAILICIMVFCFVMSMIFLCVSGIFYIGTGAKKLTECITTGEINKSCKGIDISKDDGVKVDLPGIHVIVDDKGTDVNVLGIHVDFRDDEDEVTNNDQIKTDAEDKKDS